MVQRYRSIGARMQEDNSGVYVAHDDYMRLEIQLSAIKEVDCEAIKLFKKEITRLLTELARIRMAHIELAKEHGALLETLFKVET